MTDKSNPETIDELYEIVHETYPDATREGNTIAVKEMLDLPSLESVPRGCTLTAGWDVYLHGLRSLPEGCTIAAGGYVSMHGLTSLAGGCTIAAGHEVWLPRVQSIVPGCTVTAGDYVSLSGLVSLPEGCTIAAERCVYLHCLERLPEGCVITAGVSVYLHSSVDQLWGGSRLKSVDGIATLLYGSRIVGNAAVWRASYFGCSNQHPIYVAQVGGHWAHGESVRNAIEDARIKAKQRDRGAVVQAIRETGKVTRQQYRSITGACREGVRQWCQLHGIPDDTESLPLDRVMELVTGNYGAKSFAQAVEGVAQ